MLSYQFEPKSENITEEDRAEPMQARLLLDVSEWYVFLFFCSCLIFFFRYAVIFKCYCCLCCLLIFGFILTKALVAKFTTFLEGII